MNNSLLKVLRTLVNITVRQLVDTPQVELLDQVNSASLMFSKPINPYNYPSALSLPSTQPRALPTATGIFRATTIPEVFLDSVPKTPNSGKIRLVLTGPNCNSASS